MDMRMFRQLTVSLSALGLGFVALAQDVTPLTDFRSAPGNGMYSYASSTPATIAELIQPGLPRPAVTVQGNLILPSKLATTAKMPAVVLVHGSGGVYAELVSYWAKLLNEQGIAAFVIDVFGPRGIKSTADDQNRLEFSADTADAFAALGMLASHPRIDPKRIAVMGFSRGGVAAVYSDVVRIINGAAPAGLRFAAHIAVYSASCASRRTVTPKPGVFSTEPMLFLHGDADDFAYLSPCRSYAQRISAAGTPTEFVVLPGARHKFDLDNQKRVYLRFVTKGKEECPLEFDIDDLTVHDRRGGGALSQDQVQAITRDLCFDKGATVEGDDTARETAGKAVIVFLKKVFKI